MNYGYWISLAYATSGIWCERGVVVQAPPIAKWTLGKPSSVVIGYYERKGAKFEVFY